MRLQFRRARIVAAAERMKLLTRGAGVGEKLRVLLLRRLAELLDLRLLLIAEIQISKAGANAAACGHPATKRVRLTRGLELVALLGSEDVQHRLATGFAGRFDL